MKQLIIDQTKQNRYQTVPFSVYIQFVLLWNEHSENCLGTVVILSLIGSYNIANVFWLETQLTMQATQNGCQTVPFSVYIHNLMFYFLFGVSVNSENSLRTVVILPLIYIGYLQHMFSGLNQLIYLTKPNKMGIKQFYLVCTFILWCLFNTQSVLF